MVVCVFFDSSWKRERSKQSKLSKSTDWIQLQLPRLARSEAEEAAAQIRGVERGVREERADGTGV